MKKQIVIETFLPVFPGFYGTVFEPDFTSLLRENDVNWEDVKFDFEAYKKAFGKFACSFLQDQLKEYVTSIEFQEVYSPKYYNYSNDSINCAITLTNANCKKIAKAIKLFPSEWSQYLRDKFTSCSGFISLHSSKASDWKINTSNYTDFSGDPHWLGEILEFFCQKIDFIREEDLQNFIEEDERRDKLKEFVIIPNHGQLFLDKLFGVKEFHISMVNFDALPDGQTMRNDITDIQNCRIEDEFEYLDFNYKVRAAEIKEITANYFLSPAEAANNYKLDV